MKTKIAASLVFVGVAVLVAVAAYLTQLAPSAPGDSEPDAVVYSGRLDSYLAVAPAILRAGQTENISVSLFDGAEPAQGTVQLALMQNGVPVAQTTEFVQGVASVPFPVPALPAGGYDLHIVSSGDNGTQFEDTSTVSVQNPTILFLQTDKPIYRPGQQIHMRVLRLDPDFKPAPGPVTVEIQDAKGIKVYRQETEADEFGMANVDLPLSTEPNLGVWNITASSGEQTTQQDVRVEEYVLPKYEITLDLPQSWVLARDPVIGTVSAEYSFGKPVRGEVEIVASRYVGDWEQYAVFTDEIDGSVSFELPPVQYVAGVRAAGGQGNLRLDITMREPSTGYLERTTELLTVAVSPVNLQWIPESGAFKPGLPFSLLIVAETPENRPVDSDVSVNLQFFDQNLNRINQESFDVTASDGKALVEIEPPDDAVTLTISASSPNAGAALTLPASYSPTGNFIHVEQTGDARLDVGQQASFFVHSTGQARNFYYEVVSRGRVVFSDVSQSPDISIDLTPDMSPSSRLLVYQILPDNEVAADFIPFSVSASYPMPVDVDFSAAEARPGDSVDIQLNTQGPAKVGLVAVDRSVFILAENRLNLQQVFAELERLYLQPRVEVHHANRPRDAKTRGSSQAFTEAGLVVMTDKNVPDGVEYGRRETWWIRWLFGSLVGVGGVFAVGSIGAGVMEFRRGGRKIRYALFGLALLLGVGLVVGCGGYAVEENTLLSGSAVDLESAPAASPGDLADVQRVRQYFPETWLWTDVMTDASGQATLPVEAPDSITTWMLRAVAMSPEHGLGVAETELTVFQPFFLQVDLPYSAIRGEEFPVKVALYNYLETPQDFFVELDESEDYELQGERTQVVAVAPNEVGGVEFNIRLTQLGSLPIKVTARSSDSADAVIQTLLVEPEGVARESVDNAILSGGDRRDFQIIAPPDAIPGSDRAYVVLTGSYLSQTLEGLENLLQMPYGCGEQNMILFAPNIFVARYLQQTGQLKPEVMATAEHFMTTGYQRELTYRRNDGSFSAFGQSDPEGSLWLTAFVLKSFAQADGLIYIDTAVLDEAMQWILSHRRGNGSFEPVGFVHNRDLLGGLQGNTALTAYIAIALREAGDTSQSASALRYLEGQLPGIDDPYTMAIVAYALALGNSPRAGDAYQQLMSMATSDANGLHWQHSAGVETTGYATMALLENGDLISASNAARWLVYQRNAFGGYSSTQDTVVGLQALIQFAAQSKFDVDMTIELSAGDWNHRVVVDESNADIVQTLQLPRGTDLRVATTGAGQVVAQVVHRFNLPEVQSASFEMFHVDVTYNADHVQVDDIIEITADLAFVPTTSLDAGMIVLDVAVPTGFAAEVDSVRQLVQAYPRVKRYEIAGRKVILYIEDLNAGHGMQLRFNARAQYPVRAQPVPSEAYSYYNPAWRGETLGVSVTVSNSPPPPPPLSEATPTSPGATLPPIPGYLMWYLNIGDEIYSSPAISDGLVYLTAGNNLYAFDANNGDVRWDFDAQHGIGASAVVDQGMVYLPVGSDFYALDAITGEYLWHREIDDTWSNPVLAGDTLYIGTLGDQMYALDAATGEIRWQYPTGWTALAPVFADGAVYLAAGPGLLSALDAATGDFLWSYQTAFGMDTPIAVANGTVYVVAGNILYALDAATGRLHWQYFTGSQRASALAVADGIVYVGTKEPLLFAIDAATSESLREYQTADNGAVATLAIVDDVVYMGSDDGHLYALDASTGNSLWRYQTGGPISSVLTAAAGVGYFGSQDGHLYAVYLEPPQ